jgi:hypothetical protein
MTAHQQIKEAISRRPLTVNEINELLPNVCSQKKSISAHIANMQNVSKSAKMCPVSKRMLTAYHIQNARRQSNRTVEVTTEWLENILSTLDSLVLAAENALKAQTAVPVQLETMKKQQSLEMKKPAILIKRKEPIAEVTEAERKQVKAEMVDAHAAFQAALLTLQQKASPSVPKQESQPCSDEQ